MYDVFILFFLSVSFFLNLECIVDSDDDDLFVLFFCFVLFFSTIEEEEIDLLPLSSFRHHCGINASNSD